jgi:hypothetical protein
MAVQELIDRSVYPSPLPSAFLSRSDKVCLQARLLLCKAMHAEFAQEEQADGETDQTRARTLYRGYLDLPAHQRELDPVKLHFARWRLETL